MLAIVNLIDLLLQIYIYIIIAGVIVSWLIAFEVINIRNPRAANLVNLLNKLTEPVYKPIRKYIPPIHGIDLTPIVVILIIYLIQNLMYRVLL
jgi:YggT family protein